MPTFVKSATIDAPARVVFAFHEREDVLSLLSPRFPRVKVIRKTGGIEKGVRVELSIGPFSWIALHTAYEKDRLFVDEQISGPFARWVHRHEFEGVQGGTRLTDRVEYDLPGGPLVNLLFGWLAKFALDRMFSHRHRITKRLCEAS